MFCRVLWGSDIDIFVEIGINDFVWFAMQAKVLMRDDDYDSVATKRGGEYQWEKLGKLSAKSGCITKYLFYNGVDGFSYQGEDLCKRPFNESQFGCSIVDIDVVEKIALKKTPTFSDSHKMLIGSQIQEW